MFSLRVSGRRWWGTKGAFSFLLEITGVAEHHRDEEREGLCSHTQKSGERRHVDPPVLGHGPSVPGGLPSGSTSSLPVKLPPSLLLHPRRDPPVPVSPGTDVHLPLPPSSLREPEGSPASGSGPVDSTTGVLLEGVPRVSATGRTAGPTGPGPESELGSDPNPVSTDEGVWNWEYQSVPTVWGSDQGPGCDPSTYTTSSPGSKSGGSRTRRGRDGDPCPGLVDPEEAGGPHGRGGVRPSRG